MTRRPPLEPGDEHFVVVDLFGGLVRAVLMARFDAVSSAVLNVEIGTGRVSSVMSTIHINAYGIGARFARFFVGYDHHIAVHEFPRNRAIVVWIGDG